MYNTCETRKIVAWVYFYTVHCFFSFLENNKGGRKKTFKGTFTLSCDPPSPSPVHSPVLRPGVTIHKN